MKKLLIAVGCSSALLALAEGIAQRADTRPPLTHAHAHNDYVHKHPLFDALSHGFASVEADIYLVDGQLLVAHDRDKVQTNRTLQALYLEPLRKRAQKYGGQIYPKSGGAPFYLLIDGKSDAHVIWPVLKKVLNDYADILTEFRGTNVTQRAVTVVLTGSRPRDILPNESTRLAGLDGILGDMQHPNTNGIFLWMSENWQSYFQWKGTNAMTEDERTKLKDIVAKAHDRQMKVRFWNAPQTVIFWNELREDEVDILNADNLGKLESFLRNTSDP